MKNINIKNIPYLEDELIYHEQEEFLSTVNSLLELQCKVQADTYPNKKYDLKREDIEREFSKSIIHRTDWLENKDYWGKSYLGLLIYTEEKKLIGMLTAYKNIFTYSNPVKGKEDIEIEKVWLGNLFVDSLYQDKGIGSYLMNELIAWADGLEIGLKVIEYNTKAINFYEKFGFKYSSKAKNDCEYNGINAPEIILWRDSEILLIEAKD